ncbi:crotonase/enoyl-CoA hydratase family protein [Pseudoteredinibacter isoporae]|uniref:Enoyl-CoA hydratase n=1 Tax=Pseudoteredinibacter isoporae TaxID=570281 RepID=A0A7X0JUT5_9GAMM|nr:crotonase/enoyl-CoA hydratase family protein [Pseudoteredinibacter isoporae]MBB6522673.1 enoyl-CoA hydratase [Pseudoteredinibacter isoporae]NHO88204.1 crotonase/enoyl-CoA hydratase family protein [Pseudoteredinibacter isoporae]NIB23465.1 crotonase/enoyl-CoA hydratase family protein [Pseudoteredinibacter isoporae]
MSSPTVDYQVNDRIATLTLNRPERLNAINDRLPSDLRKAVEKAERDPNVHVIILQGAGKGFCGGYDLVQYAQEDSGEIHGSQEMPWDPTEDYAMMSRNTEDFMSLWRARKPTICKIHGAAAAGGSDIALCCDMIIMADDARIGYPPARVWGVPTTMMWVYRLGVEKAKRMLFTGDLISGKEAEEMGLILKSVPLEQLDDEVMKLANRIKGVPRNQLMMCKMTVNQAYESMGLNQTQMFATFFDGVARHSPEGLWFRERAQEVGFKQVVAERDGGGNIAEGVSKHMPLDDFE